MNKQKGFVQGALLIGIALLAIVIGAFAMASNNNTSDISKEKEKTNAAVVVKKMADAFEQYQIVAAQEDIAAANTKMTDLTMALPSGYQKDEFTGQTKTMQIVVPSIAGCAQVNRVLGLATAADSDETAAGKGTVTAGVMNQDEACANFGDAGTPDFIYGRKFSKS